MSHTCRIGLALVMLTLPLCSCHHQQSNTEAQQALAEEVSARQQGREQSMRLYQEGVKAQKAGRQEQAHKCFAAAVNADNHNVYAWMALGSVNFELENYYGAAEAFYEASRLAPTRYEPHYNMGTVYEAVGRLNDAIKAYETALRLDGEEVAVMENLARACVRSNQNLGRARELIDRALLRENRPQWRQWLQMQSLRIPATTQPVKAQPAGDI
jgi:cytochrome c-type biogenesis protein CcmH/NrfG